MIKEFTVYTILCDCCSKDVMENFEYSGFSRIESVTEICDDSGWHREGDKRYCPDCFSIDDEDKLIIKN